MNLITLAEWLAEEDVRTVALDETRCLRHRDKKNECNACAQICPAAAITVDDIPRLSVSDCQGCLACLPVCPTGAFSADDAVPELMQCLEMSPAERIELVCQFHPEAEQGPAETGVRVRGCLAGLGEGALILTVARECAELILRDDLCEACPWQTLGSAVREQAAQAKAFLSLWGQEGAISCSDNGDETWQERPLYPAGSPPRSRRSLFNLRKDQAAEDNRAPVPDGHYPFRERVRLLRAVQELDWPAEEASARPFPLDGFATLDVSAECTACGTCARVCPGKALELEADERSYQLTFAPQACVACGLCVDLCPEGAVSLDTEPSFNDLFEMPAVRILREGDVTRCQRCNTIIAAAPGRTHCSVCDFRRNNPFGSALPKVLQERLERDNVTKGLT